MDKLSLLIKRVACEIKFFPTPLYYEKKTVVWKKFAKHFPDWKVNYTDLIIENKEKEIGFRATSRNAIFVCDNLSTFSNFTDLGYRLLKDYAKELQILSLNRIGVRVFYLCEADGSFEDLNNLMINKLFSFVPAETKATDMAYVLNFDQSDYHFHVTLGPVTDEESKARLEMKEGTFPKLSIFFDIDIFQNEASPDVIEKFLQKSCKKSERIAQQFGKQIFG